MARLMMIDGVQYELNDPLFEVPFTDHNGKEFVFDEYFLHNPEAHKKFGWTTVRSVLKWWIANRTAFIEACVHADVYSEAYRRVEQYFLYVPFSVLLNEGYEEIKDYLTGHLLESSISVRIGDSSGEDTFHLVQQPQPQSIQRIYLTTSGFGRIRIMSEGYSSTAVDKWSKVWNYTFKMDQDEFNWWRSVKNENSVMFGMELEICSKLSSKEIQYIVTEVEPKQEPFFIFKQDSSISGMYHHMLELVTVPCTPKYLRTHWKIFFKKLQKLCEEKGLSISDVVDTRDALSNGLHIHVSKTSFIDKGHYNKFLTAWNQWNKKATSLLNAASRRPSHYLDNSYCRINYAYEGRTLARRLKGIYCDDRMSVAHNRTGSTIEVRIYQGIFDLPHIMRSISFTEAMFEFTQSIGYSSFDMRFFSSISKFIRGNRKYASLYSLLEGKA